MMIQLIENSKYSSYGRCSDLSNIEETSPNEHTFMYLWSLQNMPILENLI